MCLNAQIEECDILSSSLEHQMGLTSEQQSRFLNLVATVFLPLTFFAGVFGMNFQVDGGCVVLKRSLLRDMSYLCTIWYLC